MSDQGTFEFIKEPPRPRPQKPEYVFFGLLAGETCEAIAECRDRIMAEQGVFGSRIGDERLHVSLSGLGGFKRIPSRIVYGAEIAASRAAVAPFEVTFSRVATLQGGRPDRHPTVLLAESDSLRDLADRLCHGLSLQGMKAGKLSVPHMTLFYSRQRIRPTDVAPIRLRVDHFHLIHSERGLSRYNVLGSWALEGPPSGDLSAPLAFGSMAA